MKNTDGIRRHQVFSTKALASASSFKSVLAQFSIDFQFFGTDKNLERLKTHLTHGNFQRIQGVKNEQGIWITPAFPKLIYVLEEDNVYENSPYWYLTELAAKCTAKRMVPDYISEKKMLEYKVDKNGDGQCYPCMGERKLWPM